jgi:hypothetical protein
MLSRAETTLLDAGVTVGLTAGVAAAGLAASVGGDVSVGDRDGVGVVVVPQAGIITNKTSPNKTTNTLISCFVTILGCISGPIPLKPTDRDESIFEVSLCEISGPRGGSDE